MSFEVIQVTLKYVCCIINCPYNKGMDFEGDLSVYQVLNIKYLQCTL